MLTLPSTSHHNVGRKSGIKVLIGAVVKKNIWLPHFDRRNSDILIKHLHTVLKMPNLLSPVFYMDISVLRGVPHESIILPVEGQPDVTCQDLILLVQVNNLLEA